MLSFRQAACAAGAFVLATLSACVTINIYFPAAAAERAADRIIDDVLELKPGASKPQAPKRAAPDEQR